MSGSQFSAFVGVSLLVIVTPGQDTALTIRNTLVGGRADGVFTALGVATGQAIWTVASSAGLAALLLASEPAFFALKLAGGIYLVFLGLQALRSAVHTTDPKRAAAFGPQKALSRTVAYRRGVISNLGNPKVAVFFTSLLPQFAPRPASFFSLLGLGLVFCSLTLLWLAAYAVVVDKAGDLLRRPRARRALDGLTGSVLVGLGLRLATERRAF